MRKIFSLVLAFAAATTMAFAAQQTVPCGDQVTIKATPKTHYYFVRWSDNNTNATRTVTVNEAMSLTAIFAAENSYTLTLTVNDNSVGKVDIISGAAAAYYQGDEVTIKATATDGCWQFLYWADDHNNTDATRTITFGTANLSYQAVFGQLEYNFTIQANDDAMGTVEFVVNP